MNTVRTGLEESGGDIAEISIKDLLLPLGYKSNDEELKDV